MHLDPPLPAQPRDDPEEERTPRKEPLEQELQSSKLQESQPSKLKENQFSKFKEN